MADQVMTVRDKYSRHVHYKVQFDQLHPKCRDKFLQLAFDLLAGFDAGETTTLFLPFEGYRSPLGQIIARRNNSTRADPWESPHNYGMAVDFVPVGINDVEQVGNYNWTWSEDKDWNYLATMAQRRGLICQTKGLEWDKPHVQHPLWYQIREHVL